MIGPLHLCLEYCILHLCSSTPELKRNCVQAHQCCGVPVRVSSCVPAAVPWRWAVPAAECWVTGWRAESQGRSAPAQTRSHHCASTDSQQGAATYHIQSQRIHVGLSDCHCALITLFNHELLVVNYLLGWWVSWHYSHMGALFKCQSFCHPLHHVLSHPLK